MKGISRKLEQKTLKRIPVVLSSGLFDILIYTIHKYWISDIGYDVIVWYDTL